MQQETWKPILCIDFDGVIHDYMEGWKDGEIYGDVVQGFFDWAEQAEKLFTLVIYSSRSLDPNNSIAMGQWIDKKRQEWLTARSLVAPGPSFLYAHSKPAAFVTIDDRGVTFKGDWSAPELQPETLRAFKPWNVT
jgi:hypothetical protein